MISLEEPNAAKHCRFSRNPAHPACAARGFDCAALCPRRKDKNIFLSIVPD